jgi:hypothetical protein
MNIKIWLKNLNENEKIGLTYFVFSFGIGLYSLFRKNMLLIIWYFIVSNILILFWIGLAAKESSIMERKMFEDD